MRRVLVWSQWVVGALFLLICPPVSAESQHQTVQVLIMIPERASHQPTEITESSRPILPPSFPSGTTVTMTHNGKTAVALYTHTDFQ